MKINVMDIKTRSRVMAFMLVLLPGCASMNWDTDDHRVSVERISSEYVKIVHVHIYKEAEGIVVSGELRSKLMKRSIPPGHVVIEVVSPDGTSIEQARTHVHRIGKASKATQQYSFSKPLSVVPPEGSTVRVMYDVAP